MIYSITSSATASSRRYSEAERLRTLRIRLGLISLFALDRTGGESLSNLISAAASPLAYAFRGDGILLFYVLAFTPLWRCTSGEIMC